MGNVPESYKAGVVTHGVLRRSPMIWRLFVVQMPNPGDVRGVAIQLGPLNGFFLFLRGMQDMVRMIFDHIVRDRITLVSPLRSRLNKYVRHVR
jgi:hypothetical protein